MRRTPEQLEASYANVKTFLIEYPDLPEDKKSAVIAFFEWLDAQPQWFTQQASTRFHCSYEGGLLEHSINVANTCRRVCHALCPNGEVSEWDAVFVGLTHDIGKMPEYCQGEPTERQKMYGYPGSITIDTSIPYMEHAHRSCMMLTQHFAAFTEEMFCAVAQHNEPWLTNTCQWKKAPLMEILQVSDYHACVYMDEPGK